MANRWRPRETYDKFHQSFDSKRRIEIFCDTEDGGTVSVRNDGPEYQNALNSMTFTDGEDDIFVGDSSGEPSDNDRRKAAAIAGDDLLQLSAIKYLYENGERKEIGVLDIYIKNRKPIPEGASKVNGITEEVLKEKNALDEAEAYKIIKEFFSDMDVFIAYNEPFDYGFIQALYVRNDDEFNPPARFDVMAEFIDLVSVYKCEKRNLEGAARYLKVIDGTEKFHNSLDDIRCTVKVFEKLYPQYVKLEEPEDTTQFRTPTVIRHWVWKNEKNHIMVRIYFLTNMGMFFFEKLDRSFGVNNKDKKGYELNEVNMEGFLKNVLRYFKVERLEDLVHIKVS